MRVYHLPPEEIYLLALQHTRNAEEPLDEALHIVHRLRLNHRTLSELVEVSESYTDTIYSLISLTFRIITSAIKGSKPVAVEELTGVLPKLDEHRDQMKSLLP